MPTVLRVREYRFFFYSDEGLEPPHIHVTAGEKLAKFWLDSLELAYSKRFRAHELNEVRRLVAEHRNSFMEAWNAHFGA
jgi:hypothetical protein